VLLLLLLLLLQLLLLPQHGVGNLPRWGCVNVGCLFVCLRNRKTGLVDRKNL